MGGLVHVKLGERRAELFVAVGHGLVRFGKLLCSLGLFLLRCAGHRPSLEAAFAEVKVAERASPPLPPFGLVKPGAALLAATGEESHPAA